MQLTIYGSSRWVFGDSVILGNSYSCLLCLCHAFIIRLRAACFFSLQICSLSKDTLALFSYMSYLVLKWYSIVKEPVTFIWMCRSMFFFLSFTLKNMLTSGKCVSLGNPTILQTLSFFNSVGVLHPRWYSNRSFLNLFCLKQPLWNYLLLI